MQIDFDEETSFEGSTMLCYAALDGRRIVCRAGMDVVTELDNRAVESGDYIGKEAVAKNLRPYFTRKIENDSFDDEDRNSVTLLVHELVRHCHVREFYLSTASALGDRMVENQRLRELAIVANPLENRLFLASVTMPASNGANMKVSSISLAIGLALTAASIHSAMARVIIVSSPRHFVPPMGAVHGSMERSVFSDAGQIDPNRFPHEMDRDRFRHERDRASRLLSRRNGGLFPSYIDGGEPSVDETVESAPASGVSIANIEIMIAPPRYAPGPAQAFSAIAGPKIIMIGKPPRSPRKMPIVIYGTGGGQTY